MCACVHGLATSTLLHGEVGAAPYLYVPQQIGIATHRSEFSGASNYTVTKHYSIHFHS